MSSAVCNVSTMQENGGEKKYQQLEGVFEGGGSYFVGGKYGVGPQVAATFVQQ